MHLKYVRHVIADHGDTVIVVEMQGDLFFSAMERLVRAYSEQAENTITIVLDVRRVSIIDPATEDILLALAKELTDDDKELIVVDSEAVIDRSRFANPALRLHFATDLDTALERCEEALIRKHATTQRIQGLIPFHEFDLFKSLTSRELSTVEGLLTMETFPAGQKIVSQGSDPDHIYLLTKGSVSILHRSDNGDGKTQRVAAFGPGVCFGDLAAIDGSKRSADVWADETSTCYLISVGDLHRLETEASVIYGKVIRNILLINIDRLRRCNQEISSLKS